MYTQLASWYDWCGSDQWAVALEAWLVDWLATHRLSGEPGVIHDWGCGTGSVALAMARRGYGVVGVDVSEAMLAEARKKTANVAALGEVPQWVRGDMASVRLDTLADVALCVDDTLNHCLSQEALVAALVNMGVNMKPGGVLIWDVNTLENYQTFWDGTDVEETPLGQLRVSATFDPAASVAVAAMTATWYEDGEEEGPDEDGPPLRQVQETVTQRYYDWPALEAAFGAAGFQVVHREGFDPWGVSADPEAHPMKWLGVSVRL